VQLRTDATAVLGTQRTLAAEVAEVTLRCGVYSSLYGIKMHFQFVGAVILGLTLSPAPKMNAAC